jgi:hypothetical protein
MVLKITALMGVPFKILECEMGDLDVPPWLLIYINDGGYNGIL